MRQQASESVSERVLPCVRERESKQRSGRVGTDQAGPGRAGEPAVAVINDADCNGYVTSDGLQRCSGGSGASTRPKLLARAEGSGG